jgi:hypothetical protein
MGYSTDLAQWALTIVRGSIEYAAELLLSGNVTPDAMNAFLAESRPTLHLPPELPQELLDQIPIPGRAEMLIAGHSIKGSISDPNGVVTPVLLTLSWADAVARKLCGVDFKMFVANGGTRAYGRLALASTHPDGVQDYLDRLWIAKYERCPRKGRSPSIPSGAQGCLLRSSCTRTSDAERTSQKHGRCFVVRVKGSIDGNRQQSIRRGRDMCKSAFFAMGDLGQDIARF